MAKLSKDIRLQETIKIQDGLKPVEEGSKKAKKRWALIGLAIWEFLVFPPAIMFLTEDNDIESFIGMMIMMVLPPVWIVYRYFIHVDKQKEIMTYKDVPNPEYDPEFAKKMRIRIKHSYGRYTLHKYDDGTYTIDDNDEFFTLHNFSFAGGDIITTTNGASFGNFTKPMGYSANFASSKSRQKKGESTITFLNASGDDTKQISAKITPNQAADLERFFYR